MGKFTKGHLVVFNGMLAHVLSYDPGPAGLFPHYEIFIPQLGETKMVYEQWLRVYEFPD